MVKTQQGFSVEELLENTTPSNTQPEEVETKEGFSVEELVRDSPVPSTVSTFNNTEVVPEEVVPEEVEEPEEVTPDTGYFAEPKEAIFGGGPSEFMWSALGSVVEAPFQFAEFVGQLIAPETTKDITDTIKDIDEKLKIKSPAYRATIDELQGTSLSETAQEISRLPSYLIGGKLFKEGAQKGIKALTKSDKGKKTAGFFGAGTGFVLTDVFTRKENETHLADIAKIVNDADVVENEYLKTALNLSAELSIDPEDTAVQKRVKQFQESLAVAGLATGVIKTIGTTFKLGTKGLKLGVNKLKAKKQAIDDGILDVLEDSSTTRINKSAVEETVTPTGDVVYTQRNAITEVLAKINTKAGRLLSSTAALPKELYKASILRSRADKAFTLSVKDNIEQLQKVQKEDDVSDELIAKYINDNVDEGLSEGVKKKADQIKLLITANESKINKMLGLKEGDKIGLGFNGGDVYFTRSFESNNNPRFLKEIKKAIKGKSKDANFIRRVEGARRYFRSLSTDENGKATLSDDEVDGAIKILVKRLSGEDEGLLNKIWEGTDGKDLSGLAGQAARILKTRKKLDKPILDLLGEQKDPFAKISATLTNQNKLMSEINYLSQVDSFFRKNVGKEVELGGLIPKYLGGARQVSGVKGGVAGSRETGELYDLSKQSIGRFGGSSNLLKDLYVSPQMYKYVKNGLELYTPDNKGLLGGILGSSFGRMLSQVSAFGQATQTVLDIPAYAINTYGAIQALASNGLLFSPKTAIAAKDAVLLFSEQLKSFRNDNQFTKAAIAKLERLKSVGVIDTDLTSEMISKNINVYGKEVGSKRSKAGKMYSKLMEKASSAYGAPDTYAKLVAFEAESTILKKTFPRVAGETLKDFDDRIFNMAADIVRDTMPSYAVASPIARTLSRLPIGTYALFPAEMVRTTKNTLKYGVKDVVMGVKNRNVRQAASGLRRLTGLGVTATGIDMYVRDNNEQNGITDVTNRVLTVLSPDWGKNSKRIHSQGLIEEKDGKINTNYINSASIDAQDYLKVPVRAIIGKLTAGKDVSDFELDEVLKGMGTSIVGPFTNPKFVFEALFNIAQKDFYSEVPGEQGVSIENVKRAVLELGKSLEPGTSQALRRYVKALTSEEIREVGKGINASGFPQSSEDIETWLTTGVRPVTVDVKKAMGFNLSQDIKAIKSTKDSFIEYLGKLDDQPYTPNLREDIMAKYIDLQNKKFNAMQKLSDKIDLFKQTPYQAISKKKKEDISTGPYETREFGLTKVLDSATSGFNYDVPDEILYANTLREGLEEPKGGIFMADDIANDARLMKLIANKSFKYTLIEDLAKEFGKLSGRKLKE